jgi:RsiW-degrading membrane proteinase PrsW (M82 family)
MLLGLAGFVGIAYLIERVAELNEPVHLAPVPAVLLAAFPALLWMGYFYGQDRHEKRPKHFIFGLFLVGAFIAGPVVAFLIARVMPPTTALAMPMAPFSTERLIKFFAITGLAQELAKYTVVRYSVYLSPEFDEPMDGVIYMTAAAIGFATYQNCEFLQSLGGSIYLSSGVAQVVVNTLAHACFAGVLGYALAGAKFAEASHLARASVLLGGLIVAAILNGAFAMVRDVMEVADFDLTPWHAVAFAFGFAAAVFIVLSALMQRLLVLSPYRS